MSNSNDFGQIELNDKPDNPSIESTVFIGSDILELLSSAMYVDPLSIYREYVQNSADAIDDAFKCGVLPHDTQGEVNITIDKDRRSVKIRDNGCGISCKDFVKRMLSIGGSVKRGTSARGFRGVGRLAGLGYARRLVFRTSARGETVDSELIWDCQKLKMELRNLDNKLDLINTIRSVTTVLQNNNSLESEHFFEIELQGLIRLGSDSLTCPTTISSYLSQVAPVPFAPDFKLGHKIVEQLSDHVEFGNLFITVNGAPEPLYRPHRDQINCDHCRQTKFSDVVFVEVLGIDGNLAGIAWILHHEYDGALSTKTEVKGLRVRIGNMQVGNHKILENLFSETRFNSWSVGEIHLLDRRIVPNGRRDQLEQNNHCQNLLNHLLPTTRAIAKKCRTNSVRRRREREFESLANSSESKLDIIAQGVTGEPDHYRLVLEVENLLDRLKTLSEQEIVKQHEDNYAKRVDAIRSKLTSLTNGYSPRSSPIAYLPENHRQIYEQLFSLIYECSSNRVAAKSLIDRIIARIV